MEKSTTERALELVEAACGHPVTIDSRLDAMALDSLEFMELIKTLESDFDVQISDNDIIHLNSVRDIVACIESKQSRFVQN